MTTASLSANLLVRKGRAVPSGQNVEPLFQNIDLKVPQTKLVKRPIRKSLRVTERDNKRLRILAARLGVSQQRIMETALLKMLDEASDPNGCICGTP